MFTFGYKFRPWDDLKVLADGASIRQYIADTAAEYGIDEKIHYGLKIVTADWSSAESRWTVTAVREATGETRHLHLRLPGQLHRLLQLRRRLPADLPGRRHVRGPEHPPAALARGPRLRRQEGRRDRQRRHRGHPGPVDGRHAGHVTMLQRSPSYVFSVPALDKISKVLSTVPARRSWSTSLARKRNIAIQRGLYLACRRWPKAMRRFLLSQVRRQVGPTVDMSHFTPNYMPWDERLCAVPDGDLFKVLQVRRGLDRHRPHRDVHREGHPAEVRPGARGGHHRHRHRPPGADARRHASSRSTARPASCTTR